MDIESRNISLHKILIRLDEIDERLRVLEQRIYYGSNQNYLGSFSFRSPEKRENKEFSHSDNNINMVSYGSYDPCFMDVDETNL